MILVILVAVVGLWLAGNWQPVGWTLVPVACLLWLPYALAAGQPGFALAVARLRRRQPPQPPQGAGPTDLAPPAPAGREEALKERPAEPGELCTCGRPAVAVYLGGRWGPTAWCGISDGGERAGPCPFCGGDRHQGRCPSYRLRLDQS